VVAAHLAVEGADQEPVQLQQTDQEVTHVSSPSPACALLATEAPLQTTVELRAEFREGRGCGRWEGADDHLAAGGQEVEVLSAQVA
jgi:hypothetical protein